MPEPKILKALALRTVADGRTRTIAFCLFVFLMALANPLGYARAYRTAEERAGFARGFGENKAVRLMYGTPLRLETVEGFTEWRAGGFLALVAAAFGGLAAVRATRSEEDSGRQELVAAGAIGRGALFLARLAGIGFGVAALWLVAAVGYMAGGLAPAGAAYLALASALVACVYAGAGVLAGQLAGTARGALGLVGAVFGADLLLRAVADTADRPSLHWAAPFGWEEEMRPLTGARPVVAALPILAAAVLLALSFVLHRRRDTGTGLLARRDASRPARTVGLGSPTALAFRLEWAGLVVWLAGVGVGAFAIGYISRTVAESGLPEGLREQAGRVGSTDIATPSGYIGLSFLLIVLAITLYACGRVAAAREEEAAGRLDTLAALPYARARWLTGRLVLALAGLVLLGVCAGVAATVGATVAGADVSPAKLIGAGLNTLPASVLFLGLGALLFAVAPRLATGGAYALVALAFAWELVGALVGAPGPLLGLSPFHQVGLVPAVPFRAVPAAAMVAIGLAASALAVLRFRMRDVMGE